MIMYKVQLMVEDFAAFTVWMDNLEDAQSLADDFTLKGYNVQIIKAKG